MERQLSLELKVLSSGKRQNSSLKKHLSSKKEQKPKQKNSKSLSVSRLLPKTKKELKLKTLSLESNTQEKKISGINALKENAPEVKIQREKFPSKGLLIDNLITIEELAVILRLAPQTIRNWMALGKIPYVRIGRRSFFQQRSLQKWLNRKEEPQWQ